MKKKRNKRNKRKKKRKENIREKNALEIFNIKWLEKRLNFPLDLEHLLPERNSCLSFLTFKRRSLQMLHTMNILLIKKSLVLRKAGLFFHITNFGEGRFSTFGRNIQSSITFQLHCRSEHYYFSFYSYRFLCIYFTFDYLEKRFFCFPLVFLFIIYSW